MIRGITGRGPFLTVYNGSPSSTYYQTGQSMSGLVRYHNNNFEVFDGQGWNLIKSEYAEVGLNNVVEQAIEWAIAKKAREDEIIKLSKTNPAVKIAYGNFLKAEEQLTATYILSKEHEKTTG